MEIASFAMGSFVIIMKGHNAHWVKQM